MKLIAKSNYTVQEMSNNLNAILDADNKYNDRHVRFKNDTLYFHSGKPSNWFNTHDRESKRKKGSEEVHKFFKMQFTQRSSLYQQFKRTIPSVITGRILKRLCDNYLQNYRRLLRTCQNDKESVLEQVYEIYRQNDVIVLGSSHGDDNSRAHSFLKDFLIFLKKKKKKNISKGHTIFYELNISLYSHYKRRKISDYSPDYKFIPKPHNKNPNNLSKHLDDITRRKVLFT